MLHLKTPKTEFWGKTKQVWFCDNSTEFLPEMGWLEPPLSSLRRICVKGLLALLGTNVMLLSRN